MTSYIQSVITRDERLLFLGHFPWIYKMHALLYLGAGLLVALFLLSIGVGLDTNAGVSARFSQLPTAMYTHAFWDTITARGGLLASIQNVNVGIRVAAFVCLLVGVGLFAKMFIDMLTTEVGVTNYRLIYKTGIIARNVGEMNLNRVESIHVSQSILGRLLNYGMVEVRGMGIGDIQLPLLSDPLALRRSIELAMRKQD